MIKSISLTDIRLGVRMLAKYPWLTIVGGLGMAVAVAIGATFFGVIYSMMDPTLPLDEGNRVVSIQLLDAASEDPERHIIHDALAWRAQSRTVADVSVYRRISRNLITPLGEPEAGPVVEMTASGFRVARVEPLKGRVLTDQDEAKDGPLVAVIGYGVWKNGFASDPGIIGRTIQIGKAQHTIVGVMPEGFAFPLNDKVWIPLRLSADGFAPREGPVLLAFGRLAPGRSMEAAQAEFNQIGQRVRSMYPETHAQLRPTVLPYTYPYVEIDDMKAVWAFHTMQLAITLLLVLVCANVATLIYARTAARQGEIAVRSALGASRRRIIGQLFAEALVLATLASVAGIVIAKLVLRELTGLLENAMGELPFWMEMDVSLGVMLYVVAVTLLAAMIIGALPALRATGKRVQPKLRQLGGGSGMMLGRTWTTLIVAQVAFAVTILPSTLYYAAQFGRFGLMDTGFAATSYLAARLGKDQETPRSDEAEAYFRAFNLDYAAKQAQLIAQLRALPEVAAATFSQNNPGEESMTMIEIEGLPMPRDSVNYSLGEGTSHGYGARANRVDLGLFQAFNVQLVAGRFLQEADLDSTANAVVVNQDFVRKYLGTGSAVGRRIRYVGRGRDTERAEIPLNRWFEIVGVVSNFPPRALEPDHETARLYHPPVPGHRYTALFIRTRGVTPEVFAPKLKTMTARLDPTLQLRGLTNLDTILREEQGIMRLSAIALITLTLSVLLLSAAGIYALMSLSVSQRRREIGVRSALGAHPRRILTAVFSRSALQLSAGVIIGIAASLGLDRLMWGELLQGQGALLLPLVAILMTAVGLLAASGPAKRGLRIQPTEALRDL